MPPARCCGHLKCRRRDSGALVSALYLPAQLCPFSFELKECTHLNTLPMVDPARGACYTDYCFSWPCAGVQEGSAAQGHFRWAVSGTPIQNSPEELFSVLHFLKYAPFDAPAAWRDLLREAVLLKNPVSWCEG